MGTAEGRLKNYSVSRFDGPRPWDAHRARHYSAADKQPRCSRHLALVPRERPTELATLQKLLFALRSEEFSERLIGLGEGRECDFFAADPLVARLVTALRTSEAKVAVEKELDDLFSAYEQGRVFEYTEVTMALLYAIKVANVPCQNQIITEFAAAKPAEFWALRRFASALLRR